MSNLKCRSSLGLLSWIVEDCHAVGNVTIRVKPRIKDLVVSRLESMFLKPRV